MTPKLFTVDTEAIKHEAQTQTQHPLFAPLSEQWERAVATLQALLPRTALVKQRGVGVVQVRTEPIPPYRVSPAEVEKLEAQLARVHGVPISHGSSAFQEQNKIAKPVQFVDWEPVTPAIQIVYDRRT
jgi:hypothetical protein